MPDTHPPPNPANALQAEVAHLQSQVAQLATLNRQLTASATLQAMRAGAEGTERRAELDRGRAALASMRRSLFWRMTLPVRFTIDLARGAPEGGTPEAAMVRRAAALILRGQAGEALKGAGRYLRRRRRAARLAARPAAMLAALPPPNTVLAPSVLIVAELSLQQCAKYRVWQKQEHFIRLGVRCRVVDWRHTEECLSAAALATQVILYRVPGYPQMMELIALIHRLRVPVAWEVDDLIFDRGLFLDNRNVDSLSKETRQGILSGVELYRTAMLACGGGIASTPYLAQVMRDAGLRTVEVVENALDADTLAVAARLRAVRAGRSPGPGVLITYGSGTNTHDADFRQAADALQRLMHEHELVRLRIVGDLKLPAGFAQFGARVERVPPAPYARYLELLSESDISIAPLEPTLFNDAKSNIKFLEAAVLGVPSVCSPRAHFTDRIRHGDNAMLAETGEDWWAGLSALATDAGLRERLGQAALADAMRCYDPAVIARQQVAPLLEHMRDERAPSRGSGGSRLRVMIVNIYYAPRSFGGATLVAEEMARRLHARGDTDVHVVTSLESGDAECAIARSDQDGIAVFSLPVVASDVVAEFDNPSLGEAFGQVLDAVQPDVVHLHSVQWLSASLAVECAARGIPYVITVHDAWWLCARQFMVREDGRYCFQTRIDLHVCQNCNPGARHLEHRAVALRAALDGAALLLSPSEAHRALYLANGVEADRIVVAPNGVRLPAPGAPRTMSGKLRLAYVGGAVEVKGFSIVKRAFEALDRADWTLLLVDNTLNLGHSSMDAADWEIAGELAIVPAYTQEGMDAFFAEVDVLVFPSQWKESFGLTVREALARDVWVIATEGGGPGEAIEEGVNGTLIPLDGRHEALCDAIEHLLDGKQRFAGYRNPHASSIAGYQAQADALHETLSQVVADARGRTLVCPPYGV